MLGGNVKPGKPLTRSSPLERKTGLKAKPRTLTQRPPRRLWVDARAKVDREAECRLSGLGGCEGRLEAAHAVGRDRDQFPIEGREHLWAKGWYVAPERIVPLCTQHHHAFDHGLIELLGRLHLVEELQAVRDSRVAHESGIEAARRRLAPLAYRRAAA